MTAPPGLAGATFPPEILEVLRTLGGAGFRSWLVGGAVRDLLLGRARAGTDFDVATPATPQEVIPLFRKVIPTGVAHGTVTVLVGGEKIEVTTFRGEGAYVDGRRPQTVTFLRDLVADLARRDFTMNAMAFDPLRGDFEDPFGGRDDLVRRLVRAVGEPAARFGEDGLRPFRAVRFAAQLGFAVHRDTRAAIPGALDVARRVSTERVADELVKLLGARHAARGVALLARTGLLGLALPDLAAGPREQLAHAVALLARGGLPPEPAVRFAALLHGFDAARVEALLVGLRLPRKLAADAAALVRAHACLAAGAPLPATPAALRRWLSGAGPERAPALLALAEAEARSTPAARAPSARADTAALAAAVNDLLQARPPLSAGELALDGRAVMALLGAGPGPHVGEALRHLLDRVLDDPSQNEPSRLEAALRLWWERRGASL